MFGNYSTLRKDLTTAAAFGLLISFLFWTIGFQYILTVHAASLTSVSDTLSDSRPGVTSNHTITFSNPTSTTAGQTIQYIFDPNTGAFPNVASTTFQNVTSTGMTIVNSCSVGSNRVTMNSTSTPNTLVFTVCASNTVASATVSLQVLNNTLTNPTSTGSYVIRINAGTSSADTRVMIVNGVTVSASVATTFTFTVSSLPTSTTLANNATTTGASTSTTLPFGTIAPNTHEELGQQLNVTTNASNGFSVTVHEDQDMQSSKGNTIHLFSNANATSTPSPWTSPKNTINNPLTYGHIGITSDDSSGTDTFVSGGVPLYAGSFQPTSTLTVFNWNGPADGTTQNVGAAKVAIRIEISPLQAAANDYSNNLIYVATPVF
jgi:hypothetical protein